MTDISKLCLCGSGKVHLECCFKLEIGRKLNLKGKNAEDFVYELAKKSFLEDWCYKSPKLPNGKEICDLLVVYDDVAIIWQVKDLKLDGSGKYNKSEIQKNLRQLLGAKRCLFKLKYQLELENPRRGKETFDPKQIKKVYLISALLGEGEDYFSFVEMIGKHIVHTFTRRFVEIILGELDTINDFIDYIREKELLIPAGNEMTLLGGEEELMAYYLANQRSFQSLIGKNLVLIDGGCWEDLQKKPEWIAKKQEDKISYVWDSIINRGHTCGEGYEPIIREMARANRFERRTLSKAFFSAHILAHNEKVNNTFYRVHKSKDATYCFVFFDNRKNRKELLGGVCFIARGLVKDNNKVIGIATEMKINPVSSYDFCLLEMPEWTEDEQNTMETVQKQTGILTNFKMKQIHEEEYPDKAK